MKVLVGQNFGEKSLPGKIDAKDFEWLLETMTSNQELLLSYYELHDDTSQTPCYVLKDVSNKNDQEMRKDASTSELIMDEMEKNNFKENCGQPCVFNGKATTVL